MNRLPLACALGAAALALLPAPLTAHGGSYKGPPDIVPPNQGGGHPSSPHPSGPTNPTTGIPGQPSTGTPSQPTTGRPPGPSTGTPSNPSAPTPNRPKTGGYDVGPDFTEWSYWWEFNKDPYLRLKDNIDHLPTTGSDLYYLGDRREARNLLRPSGGEIQQLLPTFKRALDSTDQRDITSSCMIALAKIGQNHPDFRLVDVFQPRLAAHDQEIRETAALALGIAAVDGAGELDLLCDLALDDDAGRAAGGRQVDPRTRAFALYGIGLFAGEHSKLAIKQKALETLQKVLREDSVQRDLPVAAIHGIGMLHLTRATAAEAALQDAAIQCLDDYYSREARAGGQLVQAHCPTAIVKLLGKDHPRRAEFVKRFTADLTNTGDGKRASADIARSCALALGRLCAPDEDGKGPDAACSELLLRTSQTHRDAQTQDFALLALGQIGGTKNRERLLKLLPHAGAALQRPWCALALGVMTFQRRSNAVDTLVGDALLAELRDAKTPELVKSLAVALGLCGHVDALDEMVARLTADHVPEDIAGYLCIGLALMRDHRALPVIRDTIESAARKPKLLESSAIALGCLGDVDAATLLTEKMTAEDANLSTLAALSTAIGRIGDRRSIPSLAKMLADAQADLPRAFAAVTLGCIADRAPLPWTAKVSVDINYRAVVETLLDQNSGILDLL